MTQAPGIEATKRIVAKYGESRQAIIACTASSMAEDVQRCLSAGMDDFISKPITKDKLRSVLSQFIKKQEPKTAA